jgi:hypothetical protein
VKLYFHDNTPAKPGEKHGARGPTHCATLAVDYAYQAEMVAEDAAADYPMVVRIECPDIGREWVREGNRFVERQVFLEPAFRCVGCDRMCSAWTIGPLGAWGQAMPILDRCDECQPPRSPHRKGKLLADPPGDGGEGPAGAGEKE